MVGDGALERGTKTGESCRGSRVGNLGGANTVRRGPACPVVPRRGQVQGQQQGVVGGVQRMQAAQDMVDVIRR